MRLPYIALVTIISIVLTILHSYKDPTVLYSQFKCNDDSICAVCPQLEHSAISSPLKKYTRVSHNQKFYILSTYNYLIIKTFCRDALQLVERQQNDLVLTQQMRKQLQNITHRYQVAERVSVASGNQYHAIIGGMQDYLIFYQSKSSKSPIIYIQNQANPNKLMSLSRSISWGMLFALILKYIDSFVGICNVVGHYPFPVMELFIVSYILYISYQISTFSYLYVANLMFLSYLLINLGRKIDLSNVFIIFILFVVLGQSISFLAYLFWLVYMKKMDENFVNLRLITKISTAIVIIGLLVDVLVLISKFNFLIYLNYTFKVVSIVVSFMMFQVVQEQDLKANKKEVNFGRYMVEN